MTPSPVERNGGTSSTRRSPKRARISISRVSYICNMWFSNMSQQSP
ncbi:MAG TPA: hypothetical protein VFK68_01365 [Propionibacteriaceae bacterium]|nr:hypothetical protein [Propionibacteriaceae bacterium]